MPSFSTALPRRVAGAVLRRALRRIGYDLVPRRAAPAWSCDPAELTRLEADLRSFAVRHPGHGAWSDPAAAREYLSDARIGLFGLLLDACAIHGVGLDDRRVLDVGSGTGYLLRAIDGRARPAALRGYDTCADITALARHLCPAAEFVAADFLEVELPTSDVVFATEVLEHLVDPEAAVDRLLAAVGAGGHLVLTVPDGRRDTFPALEPLANGRGYWGHIQFWSPESWALFVRGVAGSREAICGQLATGQNLAIIRG